MGIIYASMRCFQYIIFKLHIVSLVIKNRNQVRHTLCDLSYPNPKYEEATKMKNISTLILAGFIILTGSQAMAWPGSGHSGTGHGNGYACNGADLDLTPDQSVQLLKLKTAFIKAVTPFQNQMITLRSELRILWNVAQPEKEKILAKEKEMSDLSTKISEIRTTYQLDCRAVLTPDQLARTRFAEKGMETGHGPNRHHNSAW